MLNILGETVIFFQYSLMNRKFKIMHLFEKDIFGQNVKSIYCQLDQFNASFQKKTMHSF